MKYYSHISDSIEQLSEHQIQKRRRKLILPAAAIVIGLACMSLGILKWASIGYEETAYVLVFGGLFIVGWGIVMLSANSYYFVYVPTETPVKPERIYLDPDKRDLITQLVNDGKLGEVLKHQVKKDSPLMLELWRVDGHKLLYSQLLYYHDAETRGITPAVVSSKEEFEKSVPAED